MQKYFHSAYHHPPPSSVATLALSFKKKKEKWRTMSCFRAPAMLLAFK